MAAIQFIVTGDKEVNRRLKTLVPKVQKQVVRKASRAVAKLVAQEAKAKTPSVTGAARRSIKVRAIKRSRLRFGAQVVAGGEHRGDDAFYFKWLELGKEGQRPIRMLRSTLYDRASRWTLEFEKELRRFIAAA